MSISRDHRAARNAASIALADAGSGASCIKVYDAPGGTLLGIRQLAKPCGTITAEGRIQLLSAAVNDLVTAEGVPGWAEWCDGTGVPIWGAEVTNEAGAGPFKLQGTGENMTVYPGGVLALSSPALLG